MKTKEFKVFVYMQPYEYNIEAKDKKEAEAKIERLFPNFSEVWKIEVEKQEKD